MIPLTQTESDVMKIIKRWQRLYTNSPTTTELSNELKLDTRNIYYTLNNLVEKGFIEIAYPPNSYRRLIVVLYYE